MGRAAVKVFINDLNYKTNKKRILVEVKLIKEFATTLLVRLDNGKEIIRKKNRDLPIEEKV
jgi:hypothetical protein